MTKQLRELPAPDGSGKRLSWRTYGPTLYATRLNYACVVEPDGTTRVAYCEETLDYADTFRDLRVNPYVEAPKDAVVEFLKDVRMTNIGNIDQQYAKLAADLRTLIRAEVLASLTVDTLVEELVKRGGSVHHVKVYGQAETVQSVEYRVTVPKAYAYKRAKQENDERFMRERDTARAERDEARAALRRVAYASVDDYVAAARLASGNWEPATVQTEVIEQVQELVRALCALDAAMREGASDGE